MARFSTARLLKAGFLLTDCEDGKFWVLDRPPGDEANRIAAICRKSLTDMDAAEVREEIVLQCDGDFRNPALYMDGYLWYLIPPVFSDILTELSKLYKTK